MRELILLRHAHAESAAAGQDDHARGLSATGLAEAQAAGDWLREHGLRPDRVLCSDAARTRATLAALGDIGAGEVYEDASIYDASPGTLAALADVNRDVERLLLVGHNPGLETLVALLTDGTSDSGRGMPPGSIAWLHLDHDAALEPGAASLRHFWWP